MSLGVQQLLPHRLLEENQSQHSVNVELPCILAVGFSRRSLTYHKLTTAMLLAPAVAPCTLFSNRNEDSVRTYQIVLLLGSESFCLTQSKSLSPYDGFQALSVLGPSIPTPLAHHRPLSPWLTPPDPHWPPHRSSSTPGTGPPRSQCFFPRYPHTSSVTFSGRSSDSLLK